LSGEIISFDDDEGEAINDKLIPLQEELYRRLKEIGFIEPQ
jgi:hypothetical protein